MDKLAFACPRCHRINRVAPDRLDSGPRCGACKAPLDVSGTPLHVDDDTLDRLVRSSPVPVLVDFWAEWCAPCRMVAPALEELGRRHAGRLIVAKVDTDRHQRHAAALGVRGIPTLALFEGGRPVDQKVGALGLPQLEAWIATRLAG